ncbi:hypothetical protein GJ496_011553 [Pomphorhynchus laevis]|nr:hypothetical protein GJ496_011553 [Pomphorhynchus laevis]
MYLIEINNYEILSYFKTDIKMNFRAIIIIWGVFAILLSVRSLQFDDIIVTHGNETFSIDLDSLLREPTMPWPQQEIRDNLQKYGNLVTEPMLLLDNDFHIKCKDYNATCNVQNIGKCRTDLSYRILCPKQCKRC